MADDVTIDNSAMLKFFGELEAGIAGAPGPIDTFFKLFAAEYLVFVQRRYDRFSRGAGDWAPLAASTIKKRRRGKGGRSRAAIQALRARGGAAKGGVAILKDTGTLRAALVQGGPGNVIRRITNGIEIGIEGGSAAEPPLTLGALAQIHNEGLGNNPKRVILPTDLPRSLERRIEVLITQALFDLGRQAER